MNYIINPEDGGKFTVVFQSVFFLHFDPTTTTYKLSPAKFGTKLNQSFNKLKKL